MSILIKGMSMPKSCGNCYMFSFLSDSCRITNHVTEKINDKMFDRRFDDCPLIELPKHGRLIDADALMEKAFRYQIHGKPTLKVVLASALRDAQTIIESDGEDG